MIKGFNPLIINKNKSQYFRLYYRQIIKSLQILNLEDISYITLTNLKETFKTNKTNTKLNQNNERFILLFTLKESLDRTILYLNGNDTYELVK
jgi:hypothetical protein